MLYEGALQELITELGRLPGVGPKSAQRVAFHLLQAEETDALRLADAIRQVKDTVRFCSRCFNIAEQELCRICRDPRREEHQLCVVEEARDVVAVERTQEYRGSYHVLGGAISPIDGIGPEQLHITELLARLDDLGEVEVILAMNPNVEGEATSSYLSRLLGELPGVTVTRLASGLPVGGDLDYADEVTLARSFTGRQSVQE